MILGLDPGTNRVGFAFVKGDKKSPQIVEYGIIETKKTEAEKMPERLLEIANDLENLLDKYQPKKAVIEDLFFFKNQKTVISVAQARGVMLYLLAERKIEIISMTPLQIKQYLCGYGRATKQQIQFMVKKVFNLTESPKPDDAADSLGMAWLGLN